jgi:hypothetical protein
LFGKIRILYLAREFFLSLAFGVKCYQK